jgi:hypothetical protein
MDLHLYTRELLDKHLLPELKEIAQSLGIIPDGNKTRRETWVAALIGQPFPLFQSIEVQRQEPIARSAKNTPGVKCSQRQNLELLENQSLAVLEEVAWSLDIVPEGDPQCRQNWIDAVSSANVHPLGLQYLCRRYQNTPEDSPVEKVQYQEEPIVQEVEKSLDVDRVQEQIDFSYQEALAEIRRLRTENEELWARVRSQSEKIRQAKDISPVEKPSLKRVLALAQVACLDVFKGAEGGWVLSMAHLKRSFKKLRDIWDLLIADDWHLMDLFSPPLQAPKPLFAPIYSKYNSIPFCNDDLIDIWSLGVSVASSGRSPPAGGDAM